MHKRCNVHCDPLVVLFICTLVLLDSCFVETVSQLSVVTTKSGSVSGFYDESTNVTQYRAIPYAQPPVGELRFRKPEPTMKWKGILNGTQNPPACMQRHHPIRDRRPAKMSEDCLYLNIFVPGNQPEETQKIFPVLVWIHGGDFIYGYSSYIDFSLLSNQGQMIIVSIGYRLDIFGFLSSGDERVYGNAGLLDQLVALKWIKDNIESFGGDSSRITLYGESSGATCVFYHIVNPSANRHFNRAIIGGGVFIEGFDSQSTFNNVVHALKCTSDPHLTNGTFESDRNEKSSSVKDGVNPFDPVRCLQEISAESLLKLSVTLPRHSFVPIVDSHYIKWNLTKAYSPDTSQREVPFSVSCLIGLNSDGVPMRQTWDTESHNSDSFLSRLDALAETHIHGSERTYFNSNIQNLKRNDPRVSELIHLAIRSKYYSDGKSFTRSLRDAYNGKYVSFIQAVSEVMSSSPSSPPIFQYYFTLKPSFVNKGDHIQACQTDELPFVFGYVLKDSEKLKSTPDEKQLSKDMIRIWATFVAQGVPQLPNGVTWPPYEKTNRTYVELNINITANSVKQKLREGDRIFWNELMSKMMQMDSAHSHHTTMKSHNMKMHHTHHTGTSGSIAWGMSETAVKDLLMALLILAIFMTVICISLIIILCKVKTIKLQATRQYNASRNATVTGNINQAFANDPVKSVPESITAL